MTTQETNFAKEYVFQYFNSDERNDTEIAIRAALIAGYTVPIDKVTGDSFGKALLKKDEISTYINTQIEEFKVKMNPANRRTLWTAISEMDTPNTDVVEWGNYGRIDPRV